MQDLLLQAFTMYKVFDQKYHDKMIYIGNPVRPAFHQALNSKDKKNNKKKFIISVIGGSQGSLMLSKIVPSSLSLLPEEINNNTFIYQQSPEKYHDEIKKLYQNIKTEYRISSFF